MMMILFKWVNLHTKYTSALALKVGSIDTDKYGLCSFRSDPILLADVFAASSRSIDVHPSIHICIFSFLFFTSTTQTLYSNNNAFAKGHPFTGWPN